MSGTDSAAQIPRIWARAAVRFEEITKKPLADPALLSKVKTLGDLSTLLESENASFSSFRAKRHAIFGAMAAAMRPVELALDMAGGDLGSAFPPSSIVFGAVRYLLAAARGVREKYDAIINLMDALKEFTVRLETYARQAISDRLQDTLSEIIVALIEVLALSREEIRHGRFWSFGKGLIGANKEASEAWDKLGRLVEGERGLVGAETLTEVKGVSTTVTRMERKISDDMTALSRQVEALRLVQNAAKEEAQDARNRGFAEQIKAILEPTMLSEDRYWTINRSRVAGTGDWIREEEPFKSWMDRSRAVLWICGNPGSGKSYIASNLITYLREQYPQKVHHASNTSVAYFYFKEDDKKTRSFHQALRDMAYMLAQNDLVYAKFLASQISSPDDVATLSSAWRNLFSEFFYHQDGDSSVVLLLDGIDEAYPRDREEFFDLAKDIEDGGRIQLVMLGRFQIYDEIAQIMDLPDVLTIPITPTSNYADIVQYVEISISKSAFLRRASKEKRTEIVEKICSKAQGMFIWVDLMLKEVMKKTGVTSWNTLLTALDKAPRGIGQMIRHVLEGYSTSFQDDAEAAKNLNEMLAWVACTESPLSLEQLEHILKWTSGPESDMIWLERTLRIQFASIFVLTREDGLTTADLHRADRLHDTMDLAAAAAGDQKGNFRTPDSGIDDVENMTEFDSDPATTGVTFSHASIGDFFRSEREGMVVGDAGCPAIGVNIQGARVHCLRLSLDVLCQQAFPEGDNQPSDALLARCRASWLQYLTNVELGAVDKADKERIGGSLARLLLQDHKAPEFVTSLGFQTVLTKENAELLTKWLGEEEVQASLSPELRAAYASQMQGNALDVFKKIIRRVAELWLLELTGDPMPFYEYVFRFRKLRYSTEVTTSASAEAIITCAEWCELEKTPRWYRRLAMTLRNSKAFPDALEYFQKSIDADPPAWRAHHGIALTYKIMGNTQKEIEYDEQFLLDLKAAFPDMHDTAEDGFSDHFHDTYERLAQGYGSLDDMEKAIFYFRAGFDRNPHCVTCLNGLVGTLNVQERWEELFAVYRDLEENKEQNPSDRDFSRLTQVMTTTSIYFIRDLLFLSFVKSAEATGNTAFMIDAHRRAVAVARRQKRFIAAVGAEYLLSRVLGREGDTDGAARICERLILTYMGTSAERYISAVLLLVCNDLASYCLLRCMETPGGATSAEGRRHGATLEWLAAATGRQADITSPSILSSTEPKPIDGGGTKNGDNDEEEVKANKSDRLTAEYFQQITSMVMAMGLGQYYRLCGREAEALAAFRTLVRQGLRLLSDDDPNNDEEAFGILQYPIEAMGDDENTLAIIYAQAANNLHDREWGDDPDASEAPSSSVSLPAEKGEVGAGDTREPEGPVGQTGDKAKTVPDNEADTSGDAASAGKPDNNKDSQTAAPEAAGRAPIANRAAAAAPAADDDDNSDSKKPRYLEIGLMCDVCMRRKTLGHVSSCRFCLDVAVCDDCLVEIKAGTSPVKECSSKHDWLAVPALSKKDRTPPKPGMMRVAGQWVDFEEWKDSIRKKWGL